jgi:hypothetical protein
MSSAWIQRWSTAQAYLGASSIQVTGGDWSATQDDVSGLNYTELGLGSRLELSFLPNQAIRFYWIDPQHDWRALQSNHSSSFRYKLSMSWIQQPNGWYYWNPNAYLDSDIVVPHGYNGFTCHYAEFPYWMAHADKQVLAAAKVALKDFKIGFSEERPHLYNPCRSGAVCRVLDGRVTCGNALYWYYGIVGVLALVCALACLYSQIRRVPQDYRQLVRHGDDEQHWESRCDKRGTVLEMTHMVNGVCVEDFEDELEFSDEYDDDEAY